MQEQFVKYEQAVALKELGFDEPCFGRYQIGGDFVLAHTEKYVISNGTDRTEYFILRPLKSQAFEWFRKEHNLIGTVTPLSTSYPGPVSIYGWSINSCKISKDWENECESFETYEEAESSCIDKLIEIIKNR